MDPVKSPKQSLKKAEELVQKAISLRGEYAPARAFLGRIYVTKRQYDMAIAEGERAVALAPNSSFVHAALGFSLAYSGRPEEAIPLFKKAIRLSPIADDWYLAMLGMCYRMMGRYEEAISAFTKAIKLSPNAVNFHAGQAANYVLAGRMEEAQAEAAEVLRIDHKFSLERWRKGQLYKDEAYLEKLIDAMRKAGLPDKPPLTLPDKPSIAVLPFENMSGEPEQEFFSDGITEDIITALSKTPKMFVIARNSTFTYKGKPVKVQEVGRDLGVRYVLEGSVRKVGEKVRINAQLIDAKTGHHLWAEKYDRDLKDIFALQDEITKRVITALQVKLTEGEQARVWARGTNNLDAYLKFLQATQHFRSFTKNNMILTRKGMQEAINLDPNYAAPYSVLGSAHLIDSWFNWGESISTSIAKAQTALQKANKLDPHSDLSYACLGHLYLLQRQYDKAVEAGEKAIGLNPNSDLNIFLLGATFNYIRRYEEAITLFKKAQRLNPDSPAWYIHNAATSYLHLERWDEAITECKRALKRNSDHYPALPVMASAYGWSGRLDEGRAVVSRILKINPNA